MRYTSTAFGASGCQLERILVAALIQGIVAQVLGLCNLVAQFFENLVLCLHIVDGVLIAFKQLVLQQVALSVVLFNALIDGPVFKLVVGSLVGSPASALWLATTVWFSGPAFSTTCQTVELT